MVFKSGAWSIFGTLSERLFTVATYVIVSRQVEPVEFGHLILVFLYLELISYFASFGVKDNVICKTDLSEDFLSTAKLFVSVLALLLIAVSLAIVAPVAYMASGAELAGLFAIMALQPAFMCMSEFYQGILIRRKKFKELALRKSAIALLSGVAGFVSAMSGFGIFSIIVARYVYYITDLIVVYFLAGVHSSFGYSKKEMSDIWQFGWSLSLSQILSFAGGKNTDLMATAFLGPVFLAIIDVGRKFLLTFYTAFLSPLTSVSLSYISKSESPVATYYSFVRSNIVLFVPVVCMMGFFSDEIITIVFGDKWVDSISVLLILSLTSVAQISIRYIGNICIKFGRPDVVVSINLINILILTAVCLSAMLFSADLLVLLISVVVATYISTVVRAVYVTMHLDIPLLPFFRILLEGALVYAFFYLSSMFVSGVVLSYLIADNILWEIFVMALTAFVNLTLYAPFLYLVLKNELRHLR